MNTSVMDRLSALRPDPHWADADAGALIEQVLATGRAVDRDVRRTDLRLIGAQPHRRRIVVATGVLAAAAAAAVVIPSVLPADAPGGASPAAAAALHRLARMAAHSSLDEAGPTQFRHTVESSIQSGVLGEGPDKVTGKPTVLRGTLTGRLESWTSADGQVWRRDVDTDADGRTHIDTYLFAAGDDQTSYPSPHYLASLPTTPGALESYLRSHVSGSMSNDEAVFVAIGDMLRGGFAPPALRSAAIEVLAGLDHVSLGNATHDERNRPAQEFDYIDTSKRPGEVDGLFFDPTGAQIVQETNTAPDWSYTSIVEKADVADAVPAEILRTAVRQ